MDNKEFTIVGWGIAGATMAWQLYLKNIKFNVYDSTENHSSTVAAGIVNPIVFKRLTKSWNADLLMPYAEHFYNVIESELKLTFIEKKKIYKLFSSFEDENNWMVKQQDDRFSKYLMPIKNETIKYARADFGYGVVNTFGNMNTTLFLEKSKLFFKSKGINFIDSFYDYNSAISDNKHIVFCEGSAINNNPFFGELPLKPTHGEVIIIETDEFKFDHVLNKNMFVVHLKDNLYKVGATYNWDLTEPVCTEKAKETLVEKLSQITDFKYKIVDQKAGIRPTVKDRRPLLGTHNKQSNLHVFNGLGTKGVMIAPYYSEQLLNSIIDNQPLDVEVDIKRFEK